LGSQKQVTSQPPSAWIVTTNFSDKLKLLAEDRIGCPKLMAAKGRDFKKSLRVFMANPIFFVF